MRKRDLVKSAKKAWPVPEDMVNNIFRAINTALLRQESVTIYNFGKFEVVESKNPIGHNFQTNERIKLDKILRIKFIPSPKILKRLNADKFHQSI